MYLISVYFDEKSNHRLQGYINKIATRTGNTFMTDNNVPPHMTISSIEARNIDVLLPAFKKLEGNIQVGKINFVSVGQLLPYVMYVTPVMNEYLLNLSRQVYGIFDGIPDTSISRYYRPLSWLPHVTLGKKLDADQMRKAFEIMQESFSPFQAEITRVGIAKVNPHHDVMEIILK